MNFDRDQPFSFSLHYAEPVEQRTIAYYLDGQPMGGTMKTIKVEKGALLEKLKTNREKHHAAFVEAHKGYREAAVLELLKMQNEAIEGKTIRRHLPHELDEPQDYTKSYDRIIAMLEMTIEETIEIDQTQFRNYVLDEWDWSEQWAGTNSKYGNRR